MCNPPSAQPVLVSHADWSTAPGKRWLALARLTADGSYTAAAPQPVSDPSTLLKRLSELARTAPAGMPSRSLIDDRSAGGWRARPALAGAVLAGFDFPIGLPAAYAARAGVSDFLELLPGLGCGEWSNFYQVAERLGEISLRRPFYPMRPGAAKLAHLLHGLGLDSAGDLLRGCDRAHAGRRAASPLFWTMGGQQVGKAAIHGWKHVLGPGLRDSALGLAIWPFSGALALLLQTGRLVAVETYPAECYAPLGVAFSPHHPGARSGKRVQADRLANAGRLLAWAQAAGVGLEPPLQAALQAGFGPSPDGEDPFDTAIGLFGMLNVLLGRQPLYEPQDEITRKIEGWIFGQAGK